ncbi:MAG TPA: tripartite tricarboxylate transporter TctB family protein [Methylomirabilota bacterium]|nr:tripartite tricarboxylate transporter TctB family protein [Methylomirabilota bacterium]
MAAPGGGGAGPLAVAGGVTALGLFFLVGARWIEGEAAYAGVGPRAFPVLIGAGLTVLGLALCGAVARGQPFPDTGERARWAPLAWIAGGLAAATVTLVPAGFPVAAALLFAATARAFGSRRLLRDALSGLGLGAVTWLLFARGLGVSLPGWFG